MVDMVADAYASMSEFRTYLRVTATTDATDPDSALELGALEAAARAIENYCSRHFEVEAAAATARLFGPPIWPQLFVPPVVRPRHRNPYITIDDLADPATITSVKTDLIGDGDFINTITTYRMGGHNLGYGRPYTRLLFDQGTTLPSTPESIEVTAKWGWTAIPQTITAANLLQAARFFKRRDSVYGIAGSPEMGNEMRLLQELDRDVGVMLGGFKRNWGAV